VPAQMTNDVIVRASFNDTIILIPVIPADKPWPLSLPSSLTHPANRAFACMSAVK